MQICNEIGNWVRERERERTEKEIGDTEWSVVNTLAKREKKEAIRTKTNITNLWKIICLITSHANLAIKKNANKDMCERNTFRQLN